MTPMQQLFLGQGGKKSTYLDDVFSSYVYTGTGSTRSINTSVDMSKGGLVWIKDRENGVDHNLYDTERGVGKYVSSNLSDVEDTSSPRLNAFNSNGFGLGGNSAVNGSGTDFASWSFRKAKGFFDIVKFVGDGSSSRTISHNLGCKPGLIIFKNLDTAMFWAVWHKDLKYVDTGGSDDQHAKGNYLRLNENVAGDRGANMWPAEPTATNFTVGSQWAVNENTKNIVAYLFAGGESDASEAVSVDFDGNDYLSLASTSDVAFGTGDFTVEAWVKTTDYTNAQYLLSLGDGDDFSCGITNSQWFYYNHSTGTKNGGIPTANQWTHFAVARSSGTSKLFINGIEKNSWSDSRNFSSSAIAIGRHNSSASYYWDGDISNLRVVKGTAVYTSSFRPPTEPLTNITNTKLLCCNDSSTTGSTVSPGTITANGNPTASSDSPFYDPAAYIFGEEGNQSIIKCGTFSTTASSANVNVELGWEPQWVITKKVDGTSNWNIWDTMRGWTVPGVPDSHLEANDSDAEYTPSDYGGPHSTGFHSNGVMGYSGEGIYIAIRRLDPLVQKPVETATSVFAMDTGNSSSTIPTYDSGFPVDFAFARRPTATDPWYTSARLMNGKLLESNTSAAQATSSNFIFDSNNGWAISHGSDYQSWMWKRHAGFDVVTDTSAEWVKHNLNKIPEMVIIKNRTSAENWFVWHKDLNGGGSNSIGYFLGLNSTAAQANWGNVCPIGNTLPTAIAFQSDSDSAVRNEDCIAFLFASTDVSKVGSYTGNGNASSGVTITTGFQPRFYIIKRVDGTGPWYVVDSLRGMSNSGDEKLLKLDSSDAQVSDNIGDTSSTGFTITSTNDTLNGNGDKYLYYAHS